ncbi:hypothetical protein BDN72DRAFT_452059 [Pluteus cervinus]|uniref:Uncharacterized protein n=1 Tax=Pluteus cervinus TaxID=181527 RepID=A0ACD3BDI4_9AGAR|nr:hypothetical protein BDN72DRAFT_452059 [Pluteus cervinus]
MPPSSVGTVEDDLLIQLNKLRPMHHHFIFQGSAGVHHPKTPRCPIERALPHYSLLSIHGTLENSFICYVSVSLPHSQAGVRIRFPVQSTRLPDFPPAPLRCRTLAILTPNSSPWSSLSRRPRVRKTFAGWNVSVRLTLLSPLVPKRHRAVDMSYCDKLNLEHDHDRL